MSANVHAQWAYDSRLACANVEVVRPLDAVLYEASAPMQSNDGHAFAVILEPKVNAANASGNAATTVDQACGNSAAMGDHLLIIQSNEVMQALQDVGVSPTAIAVARN